MMQIKYIVKGDVQGVGFRATAQKLATELGLTGTACNLPGGAVELIVQGSLEKIQLFIQRLKNRFTIHQMEETPQALGAKYSQFRIVH